MRGGASHTSHHPVVKGGARGGAHHLSAADVSEVDHQVELRRPQGKLPLPGNNGGERDHQKEGSVE